MSVEELARALYFACVDFELRVANLLGVTYRDVNAGLFFVLWPLVTLALLVVVGWQRRVLRRLSPARGQRVSEPRTSR